MGAAIPAVWLQPRVLQPQRAQLQRGGGHQTRAPVLGGGGCDHWEPRAWGQVPQARTSRDFPICSWGARKPDGQGRGALLPPPPR